MPTPSIGRQVHFYRSGYEGICIDASQPMTATITFVHNPKCVNLLVAGHKGDSFPMEGVKLRQEGEGADLSKPYCEWPPRV